MTTSEPRQSVYPVLRYADCDKAITFLVESFGLREHFVARNDAGGVEHAELAWDDDLVMLGPAREPDAVLGHTWVYLATDDVDGLHERAVAAGAAIELPPTDQDYGSRDVIALDPEGNHWCFGTFRPSAAG